MSIINAFHLEKQKQWSRNTFGPDFRYQGIVNHIRKELAEIEENPHDLEEWIDVSILAFDGAWRSGYSSEEIIQAFLSKMEKNRNRKWPDWRLYQENEPIEHLD